MTTVKKTNSETSILWGFVFFKLVSLLFSWEIIPWSCAEMPLFCLLNVFWGFPSSMWRGMGSPPRGSESRSLGEVHQKLPGGTFLFTHCWKFGCCLAKRSTSRWVFHIKAFVSILKGKISALPENNEYRILEIQILVFTHIRSCKCRTWPRNFIQVSNLPLTSTGFYYIWTKQSS